MRFMLSYSYRPDFYNSLFVIVIVQNIRNNHHLKDILSNKEGCYIHKKERTLYMRGQETIRPRRERTSGPNRKGETEVA